MKEAEHANNIFVITTHGFNNTSLLSLPRDDVRRPILLGVRLSIYHSIMT